MNKHSYLALSRVFVSICLSGCGAIGDKMTSMSIIYAAAAVISLLLFVGFNYMIRKKDVWYQLLFASIFVVNLGYFTLSISQTLEEALLANRISYLGSVFLPMSMFLLILNVSKIKYKRWVPGILLTISTIVFLIAASPGYSTIYYQDVTISVQNGATVLNKVYGPLHCIYLYYLLGYFSVMVFTTVYAVVKKKMGSTLQAMMLLFAVLINILVWLIEQLIHIDFEFLSISYIISELFLIFLHFMVMEQEILMAVQQTVPIEEENSKQSDTPDLVLAEEIAFPAIESEQTMAEPATDNVETDEVRTGESETVESAAEEPTSALTDEEILLQEQLTVFIGGLSNLTPTERTIYNLYVSNNTTKEIMAALDIKENTLKFHNKNIYGKLGVSSRKQLLRYASLIQSEA